MTTDVTESLMLSYVKHVKKMQCVWHELGAVKSVAYKRMRPEGI